MRSTQRLKKTQIRSATWGRLQALCTKKRRILLFPPTTQHSCIGNQKNNHTRAMHPPCWGPRPHLVCPYKSQAPGQILADIKGSHQNMQSKKR